MFIGVVLGFEEEYGGLVVGEVFGELVGGVGWGFGDVVDIGVYSDVEWVFIDDLMKMGRWDLVGVDERVEMVDDELGVGELEYGCLYVC